MFLWWWSSVRCRCPTWAWRTAWITIRVSLSCRVAARRSVSPCRPPTWTSSRCGCATSRCSWMTRASSCMVRRRTQSSANQPPGHAGVLMFGLRVIPALQSPIEYQKEKIGAGSSTSLTRNRSSSGNRPGMSNRPSSAVGLGEKAAGRGRSQMRVSTSNGGPSCFESRVSSCKRRSTCFVFFSVQPSRYGPSNFAGNQVEVFRTRFSWSTIVVTVLSFFKELWSRVLLQTAADGWGSRAWKTFSPRALWDSVACPLNPRSKSGLPQSRQSTVNVQILTRLFFAICGPLPLQWTVVPPVAWLTVGAGAGRNVSSFSLDRNWSSREKAA